MALIQFLEPGEVPTATLTNTAPQSIGLTNSVGISTFAARADHVHEASVKPDGTGASGTWPINISGSAQTIDGDDFYGRDTSIFRAVGGYIAGGIYYAASSWRYQNASGFGFYMRHSDAEGVAAGKGGLLQISFANAESAAIDSVASAFTTFSFDKNGKFTAPTFVGSTSLQAVGAYSGALASVQFTARSVAMAKAGFIIAPTGTITVNASNELKWTGKFIILGAGAGADFSTNGYFDVSMPAEGVTITGVNGASDVAVTAGGIPIGIWQALYYVLPIGSNNTSLNANFRIAGYGSGYVPENWILLCHKNNDTGVFYFPKGISLEAGESYDASNSIVTKLNQKANSANPTLTGTIALNGTVTTNSSALVTNLNADLLDGQQGSYYNNADNLNAGIVGDSRLPSRMRNYAYQITDWNTATTNGWYMATSATNAPEGSGSWYIGIVTAHNSSWVTQEVWQFSGNSEANTQTWRREMNGGNWGPWTRVWKTQDELDARYALKTGGVLTNPSIDNPTFTNFTLPPATTAPLKIYEIFSGTSWSKPSTGTLALIELWGGGGAGGDRSGLSTGNAAGGGGGGYLRIVVPLSWIDATCSYTIGAGGISGGASSAGLDGGSTTFTIKANNPSTSINDEVVLVATGGAGGAVSANGTACSGGQGGDGYVTAGGVTTSGTFADFVGSAGAQTPVCSQYGAQGGRSVSSSNNSGTTVTVNGYGPAGGMASTFNNGPISSGRGLSLGGGDGGWYDSTGVRINPQVPGGGGAGIIGNGYGNPTQKSALITGAQGMIRITIY